MYIPSLFFDDEAIMVDVGIHSLQAGCFMYRLSLYMDDTAIRTNIGCER